MNKKQLLAQLKLQMDQDKALPLHDQATHLVFGEGNPDAIIYFLGEAPGHIEDITGRPFTGPAGKLFNKLLESIGLKREKNFISNLVGFRPPNNRDPNPQEIAAFSPMIDGQLKIIKPKIIVTLGRIPMNKFLPDEKISKIHGQVIEINWQGEKIILIPMYHPAAALKNSEVMRQIQEDFQIIPNFYKPSR